jgi:hypothetical protein
MNTDNENTETEQCTIPSKIMDNMFNNMFKWLKDGNPPKIKKECLKEWDVNKTTDFSKMFKEFKINKK